MLKSCYFSASDFFFLSFSTDSGLIAGVTSPIISAFVILVVGSIAAYTAYKNNKLCFKPRGKTKLFPISGFI